MLKEMNDHITVVVQRCILKEKKDEVRKQVVQSKYSLQEEKALRVAQLRDRRIQTSVKVDMDKKKRKIISAEEYHHILTRQFEHSVKMIDELEKQAMYL
jgi:hypothetical protein